MDRIDRRPVLVTGGAGFLGSHLCERLLEQGRSVLCLDNLTTGDARNVGHLTDHGGFRFLREDVARVGRHEVSAIFNLASPASPVHYQSDPLATLLTNVQGTRALLELAKRCRVRLFQASTSEVYGNPTEHPQKEQYWGHVNPIGPRACYDEGKRCAETLCFIYLREHDVPVRVARIFNTYGPRMQIEDGRVVSNFIVQALRNEPLTIYGDGSQTRSFCYVDDLIAGILRITYGTNGFSGPVNLGNPAEIPVIDLAHRVLTLTGSRSRIVRRPLPTDDPPRRRPDISLARERLGWQPSVSLDRGLALTIADFDRRLSRGKKPRPRAAARGLASAAAIVAERT